MHQTIKQAFVLEFVFVIMYDSVDGIIRKAGMMKNNNIQSYEPKAI